MGVLALCVEMVVGSYLEAWWVSASFSTLFTRLLLRSNSRL
jgi:hypothetical protein